jgi:lipid A disaccharide synthetase
MRSSETKHIFLSSLEHSAEMHCANLIGAVKDKLADGTVWPGADRVQVSEMQPMIRFSGFGGQRLAEAGCELLDDALQRAGPVGVL